MHTEIWVLGGGRILVLRDLVSTVFLVSAGMGIWSLIGLPPVKREIWSKATCKLNYSSPKQKFGYRFFLFLPLKNPFTTHKKGQQYITGSPSSAAAAVNAEK